MTLQNLPPEQIIASTKGMSKRPTLAERIYNLSHIEQCLLISASVGSLYYQDIETGGNLEGWPLSAEEAKSAYKSLRKKQLLHKSGELVFALKSVRDYFQKIIEEVNAESKSNLLT